MSVVTIKEVGVDLSTVDAVYEDALFHRLSAISKPRKVRISLAAIGLLIVVVTWLAVSNTGAHTPDQVLTNLFGLSDASSTQWANTTDDVYEDPPPCPTAPPKTDCPILSSCNCEPPERICPPQILKCRGCPEPEEYEPCSADKCKCPSAKYTPAQNPDKLDSVLPYDKIPTLDLLRRSKPGTRQRLLMINKVMLLAEPWIDLLSPRTTNTGLVHSGQGGNVGKRCHICRERSEWMNCVYRHSVTGYAIKNLTSSETIISMVEEKLVIAYQVYTHNTGFLGFRSDYAIHPNTMPSHQYHELEVKHYDMVKRLHRALSLEWEEVDGTKGVCTMCPEVSDTKNIEKHIKCVWLGSVGIMDLLTPNEL